MDQIRIRHCKLHLRRTSGWSWGPDPNHLLQMATHALPELIARRLMQLLADQQEPLIINRLSIKVPIKLSELTEFTAVPGKDNHLSSLSDRISRRLEQALTVQANIGLSSTVDPEIAGSSNKNTLRLAPPGYKIEVISLLVEWYRQGTLVPRLRHFSHQALIDWEMLTFKCLPERVPEGGDHQLLATEVDQFCQNLLRSLNKLTEAMMKRLVVLAALLQRYPERLSKQKLLSLLERFVPIDMSTSSIEALHQLNAGNSPAISSSNSAVKTEIDDVLFSVRSRIPVTVGNRTQTARSFEVHVRSILPFVSVGILSRLGYFDVLAAALKAGDAELSNHYFAVALAYKMLAAPQRGWHREAVDLRTAAAVAGLDQPVHAEEMDYFAFNCRHCLSPLDAHLKLLLTQGHDPSCALLIHPSKVGDKLVWSLMDTQGCFSLGWFSDWLSLLEALEGFAGNTFLISDAATTPTLFAELTSRRYRFVTSLPPSRADKWRSIDRRRQFWTNDFEAQTRWLLKQSQCLPTVTATANQITQALILERPVLPTQSQQAYSLPFEQSLALAASSALGTIAWQLWGDKETTDPVLTLQRLGNLEGRVTISSEKITVRPFLGRRYQDLYRHNFLVDVINLPWLGGRRLEFAGS